MGFELSQVISDDKHYSPYICGVCQNLVALDAVVTRCCSHPFCRQCIAVWSDHHHIPSGDGHDGGESDQQQQQHSGGSCPCPACQADIITSPASAAAATGFSMDLGNSKLLAVQALQKAQPLAYRVLANVQVACIDRSDGRAHCEWSGDYIDFIEHALGHGDECAANAFISGADIQNMIDSINATRPYVERSLSSPSVISTDKSNYYDNEEALFEFDGDDDDMYARREPATPGPAMQKSTSTKELGDSFDEINGSAPSLVTSPSNLNASIASPPASRKDKESSSGLQPATPPQPEATNNAASTASTASSQRDAPPCRVQRTVSEDGSFAGGEIRFIGKGGGVRGKKRGAKSQADSNVDQNADLEVSYSHALDWNTSISSFGNLNNSYREQTPMETLAEEQESQEFTLEFEPDSNEYAQVANMKKIMEKAEKLKKQANAKFNKGDFASARSLYSEGINVMCGVTVVNAEEKDLLSNMHSNRAVTYFREKKFEECIEDCNKAIGYDPSYDKSWIRKWRALMALGSFDAAYHCLQSAAKTIPGSKRILEELNKSAGDKQIIDEARAYLDKGEYQTARDMLKPYSRNSDNLGLLMLAAKADAGLGHTESALEKVNRALRFNPQNTEGLEVRGHILFLTGETEKGAHLLQEAYGRNRDNRSVRLELMRCQKTHSALSKGRSCVKRGRYAEALEHFSSAIKESGRLPPQAPLYGQLRTERAEAFLLSRKFMEALKDCDDVLKAQQENATAWSVRAEILIALGKADEAKHELERIRSTWGADNPTIDEGYRRVDFELRVLKEDDELMKFVADLESGQPERLPFELFEQKPAARKSHPNSHEREKRHGTKGGNRNSRNSSSDGNRRKVSGERHRSKSRPKSSKRDLANGYNHPEAERKSSGKENKRRERGPQEGKRRSRSQSVKRS